VIKPRLDPIVEEFIVRECVADRGIIPMGRKRRIARKVYRWAKAVFFGVPVMGFLLRDVAEEIFSAGTQRMTRKIAWKAVAATLPPAVSTIGLCIYKVTTSETIRKPVAVITNVAGYCYTIPMWVTDHSALYFFEQFLFGAPVPLFPDGRVNVIANETIDSEVALRVREALQPFVDKMESQ